MKTTLKKLNMGHKTSQITLEHPSSDNLDQHDEIMAIAILLGGYNEFGRKIPIGTFQEIKAQFDQCIHQIKARL
jgi:hypothetical protein